MANYILTDISSRKFDSGPKARNDAAFICGRLGYKSITLFDRNRKGFVRITQLLWALFKLALKLEDEDNVVIQYPYQAVIIKLIYKILSLKRKNIKYIVLIHDILYLRAENNIADSIEKIKNEEISIFNQASFLIVHNPIMERVLRNDGVITQMCVLKLFDYIYDGDYALSNESELPKIVFAGNISKEKSGFLYRDFLKESYEFNVYGNPKIERNIVGVNYQGSFSPDDLIKNIHGHYGLVWDGSDIEGCSGNYGNYLCFNNPHKLSMYIAAGLPVIVWKESALSDFVEKEGIGITINSLTELNDLIKQQTSSEYDTMKSNVMTLSEKVRTGFFLSNIIRNVLKR